MSTNTKIMKTDDLEFASLSNQYNKFLVPPFQRAYTWKPRHLGTLWQDMLENEKGYFIGSTVVLEPDPKRDDRVTVIDGQQRMFTISLFVLALEEKWRDVKEYLNDPEKQEKPIKEANKLRDNYLVYDEAPASSLESNYILRIYPDKNNLREVYEDLIFKKININDKSIKDLKKRYDANQMRFIRNYKRIQKMVDDYVEGNSYNERAEKLTEITEKVLSLLFIVIMCDTESDAYKIFEGLNATGIDLTVSDLVKNAVLRGADEGDRRDIQETWEDMESIFEEVGKLGAFPRYLRHQWISESGYITKSKLYDKIKDEKINNKKSSAIKKYANNLLNDAKIYAGMRFEKYEKELDVSDSTVEIIKRFRHLKLKQAYEVLLSYYKKFQENEEYSEKQLRRHLEDLWIFSFRATIVNLNPSDYERVFAQHCKDITNYSGKKFNRIDTKFKNKLRETLKGTEEQFIDNLATEFQYKRNNIPLMRYLLKELFRKENPSLEVRKPTIEHILPHDPKKWGFKKSDIENFVDKVGNLTLLFDKDNKKVGNAPMEVKVEKVFSKSKLSRHKKISGLKKEFEEDPESIIEERGVEIAKEINSLKSFKFN